MSDKRFKVTLFVLGTTLGVAVGAGLVYFLVQKNTPNKPKKDDNLVKKLSNKVINLITDEEKKARKDSALKGKSLLHDVDYVDNNSYSENTESANISKQIDTTQEVIDVKKDELVKIVSIDVLNLSTEQKSKADSILRSVAGIK